MRILSKEPMLAAKAEHIKICPHCAFVIAYLQKDVKEYSGRDWAGGSDGQEWVNCGNCNEKIIIRSW
jgi:hypothetical protein